MVVGAVLCLFLAALLAGSGLRALRHRRNDDITGQVLRMMAPTQFGAAAMLTGGAVVALAAPASAGRPALIMAGAGALATVAAGSWQGARYAARRQAGSARESCGSPDGSGCGGCDRVCGN